MSDSRTAILETLRRKLKRGPLTDERRTLLEQRIAEHPRNLVPARAQLPHAEQVELFVHMAEQAAASVQRVADSTAVPAAVAEYVERQNLPEDLVVAPAAEFDALPWQERTRLRIERRYARNGDRVAVSPAFAGIAETGTLLLLSGPDSPTTLNFLPDAHIVVLPVQRVVGPYEDAWQRLRERNAGIPRTLNLITGPSRSADIEQTLQLGAHGPIQLHIILVGTT
jgi:L-lactate dehydrogenase complex protein LldG